MIKIECFLLRISYESSNDLVEAEIVRGHGRGRHRVDVVGCEGAKGTNGSVVECDLAVGHLGVVLRQLSVQLEAGRVFGHRHDQFLKKQIWFFFKSDVAHCKTYTCSRIRL